MKKKLKLKLTGVGSMLSKEKLKYISGGDGSGSGSGKYDCGVNCWDGTRQGTNSCMWEKVASICVDHGGIQYGFNCTCPY